MQEDCLLDSGRNELGCGLCRCAAFDNALGDSIAGKARRVVKLELPHQVVAVLLNCLDADAQLRCNLFAGVALGDQLEDLQLARTQAHEFLPGRCSEGQRLLLPGTQPLGNGGAKNVLPACTRRMARAKSARELCFSMYPAAPAAVTCSI